MRPRGGALAGGFGEFAAQHHADQFEARQRSGLPLPDQAATVPGGTARHVVVGEDTIIELLAPGDGDSIAARDLARVGQSVTGVTFTVRDLARAAEWLDHLSEFVAEISEHEIRLDVDKTSEILPALKRAFDANAKGRPAYVEFICSHHPVHGGWVRPA